MKTAIIYKTFMGASEHYAQWLKEALAGSEIFKMKEINGKKLGDYDLIVVLSGTYAGWMPLNRYLKKNWQYIENKHVVAVASGGVPPEHDWSRKTYERIPVKIRAKIKYFKLPGRDDNDPDKNYKQENLKPVIEHISKLI